MTQPIAEFPCCTCMSHASLEFHYNSFDITRLHFDDADARMISGEPFPTWTFSFLCWWNVFILCYCISDFFQPSSSSKSYTAGKLNEGVLMLLVEHISKLKLL